MTCVVERSTTRGTVVRLWMVVIQWKSYRRSGLHLAGHVCFLAGVVCAGSSAGLPSQVGLATWIITVVGEMWKNVRLI
jgi:hypothetical protein